MTTIEITPEIKLEIENSIVKFQSQIDRELAISEDLRYNDKITLWENKIIELKEALTNGYL